MKISLFHRLTRNFCTWNVCQLLVLLNVFAAKVACMCYSVCGTAFVKMKHFVMLITHHVDDSDYSYMESKLFVFSLLLYLSANEYLLFTWNRWLRHFRSTTNERHVRMKINISDFADLFFLSFWIGHRFGLRLNSNRSVFCGCFA